MLELVQESRRCTKCLQDKPAGEFYKANARGGKVAWCKPCTATYYREYWRKRNAEGRKRVRTHDHHRRKCLKRKYGITVDEYNRLFTEQGGVCCICGSAEAGNPYGVLCVEHDHATGKVRGLVCQPCNFAIGWYEQLKDHPHLEKIMAHVNGD